MSTERPRPPSAAEICASLRLEAGARALLDPAMTPLAFVEALLGAKRYVAAIEFIAQTLPHRTGLWWALLCAQHATANVSLEPAQANLFRLATRWLSEPAEPIRKAAESSAHQAGAGTLGGLLGFAVALHGEKTGAGAIANTVKLASTLAPPPAMLETQRAYAVLGLHTRPPQPAPAPKPGRASILECA
jgi:hypothetical protein